MHFSFRLSKIYQFQATCRWPSTMQYKNSDRLVSARPMLGLMAMSFIFEAHPLFGSSIFLLNGGTGFYLISKGESCCFSTSVLLKSLHGDHTIHVPPNATTNPIPSPRHISLLSTVASFRCSADSSSQDPRLAQPLNTTLHPTVGTGPVPVVPQAACALAQT